MAQRTPKHLRHFVYAREDVLREIRGHKIIINEHLLQPQIRNELYHAFSTDIPDSARMAAFAKPDPAQGESPYRDFFLFKLIPGQPEWLFGKGSVEHRGDDIVGYYDSYVFHGVLLNQDELSYLNFNPFFLAPLLRPAIGENRTYMEPIFFPRNIPPLGVARLNALKSFPLNFRMSLFNFASHFLKQASFSKGAKPKVPEFALELDESFWNFIFLMSPPGLLVEKNFSITTCLEFLNPHWREGFFYGGDIFSRRGNALAPDETSGVFSSFMFSIIPKSENIKKEMLDLVPKALSSLSDFSPSPKQPQYQSAHEAFDGTLGAAMKDGVGSLADWPENVSAFCRERLSHFKRVWERNASDFGLPGDMLSSSWAKIFIKAALKIESLEQSQGCMEDPFDASSYVAQLAPYLKESENSTKLYSDAFERMARIAGEPNNGHRFFSWAACDSLWLLSPNLAELVSVLDDSKKSLFFRAVAHSRIPLDEKQLAQMLARPELAKSLLFVLCEILWDSKKGEIRTNLEKKALQVFTACTNVNYNTNGIIIIKESIKSFSPRFSVLGFEWDNIRKLAGIDGVANSSLPGPKMG